MLFGELSIDAVGESSFGESSFFVVFSEHAINKPTAIGRHNNQLLNEYFIRLFKMVGQERYINLQKGIDVPIQSNNLGHLNYTVYANQIIRISSEIELE